MTSSLLLKCDTYASTLGKRHTPVAPSLVTGIPVPRRPVLNWRPDRCTQRLPRRRHVAIVKASSETEAGVGTSTVKFQCLASVEFGEMMKIVGGGDALGNWDLDKSPSMTWGEGDIWTAFVELPPGTHELKCVKIRGDGSADWEPGRNRVVEVSATDVSRSVLTVDCRFLEAENTVVTSFDESDTLNLEAAGPDPHESDSSIANGITLPDEFSIEAVHSKGDGGSDAESGKRASDRETKEIIAKILDEKLEAENLEGSRKEPEKTSVVDEPEEKPEVVLLDAAESGEKVEKKLSDDDKLGDEMVEGNESKPEFDDKSKQEFEGKEEGEAETTKAQTVNQDVSELVKPGDNESSNAATKDGESSTTGEAAAGDWFAIALGLIAAPVVAWSEYTLKISGCGLEPGPGGLLGALEGVSYLTVVGLASYFLYKRFSDRPDPAGAAVLVETASYGTILGGIVVLALQFKEFGYIPSALPDDKCPAQPTPLPEIKLDFKVDFEPLVSGFSKVSLPSMPPLPSLPPLPSAPSISPPLVNSSKSSTNSQPEAPRPAPSNPQIVEETTEIEDRMVFPGAVPSNPID